MTLAASDYKTLDLFDKNLQNEFNLSNVLVQTDRQAGEKLMLLEGWVPTEKARAMEEALEKDNYFYQAQEIEEGDKVPILLKNGKFAKLYEPITRMFSLPYNRMQPVFSFRHPMLSFPAVTDRDVHSVFANLCPASSDAPHLYRYVYLPLLL